MKAIVCPQCGGLIDDVSERRTIAKCGYCGAKVIIQQAEKPGPEPPVHDTLRVPLENYKPFDEYDTPGNSRSGQEFYAEEPMFSSMARVIGVAGSTVLVLLGLVFIGFMVSRDSIPEESFTSTPAPYRTATPFQPLRVEPVTAEDAISLPKPVIPKNLKIARRMDVEVYVSVDEQGNVYDATANTNNQDIAKITVEAARRAKFRPSPTNQRTSGLLIYTVGPQ